VSKKKVKVRNRIGRNEQCPCESGNKFKYCHGRNEQSIIRPEIKQFIDTGEEPVRWVISSSTGTAFFVDKAGRVLVFPTKAMATEIQRHELFSEQDPNEINVAGVGPSKWAHLQEILPFVEVASAEAAVVFIQERIEAQQTISPEEEVDHGPKDSEESEVSAEGSGQSEAVQG